MKGRWNITNNSFLEIDLFAISLFILLFFRSKHLQKNKIDRVILNKLMIFITLMMISDIAYFYIDGKEFLFSRTLNNLFIIIYFTSTAISSFICMHYTYYMLYKNLDLNKSIKVLSLLPMVLLIIMIAVSPFTHWIFYIDADNRYIRGNLYIVQLILTLIYIIACMVISMMQYKKEILSERKKECMNICIYLAIPLVGGIAQGLFAGMNILVPTIVLSIVMIYIDNINREVSLDPLTKLNNRGQLDKYINEKIKKNKNNDLFLIFFDINRFKLVNDKYGHLEGDKAIVCISLVLKTVFENTDAFLARYGGDEFAVVVESDYSEIEMYIKEIHNTIAELSKEYPYELTVSVGYSKYGVDDINTIDEWLKSADDEMYRYKKNSNMVKSINKYL